jgi:hypothetical protein
MEEKEASDIVSSAWRAVDDSILPEVPELQAAALSRVIDLLAGAARVDRQSVPAGEAASPGGGNLDRLAAKLQIQREAVEDVFTEDAGGVEISIHPARLAPSKSAATRQIALLVASQRQAAGEDQTPVDEIRRVALEFGRYDAPNFSSAVNELRGAFLFKGPPRQRVLKLTRAGWAQASDLIRDLAGRDDR